MTISHYVVPAKRWQFKQGSIFIRSESFDSLVKDVTEHRRNNNIPIGNPEEDIKAQIAKENPHLIVNEFKIKIQ